LLGTHESDNDVEAGSEKRGCCTLLYVWHRHAYISFNSVSYIFRGTSLKPRTSNVWLQAAIDFWALLFLGIPRNSCHAPTTQLVAYQTKHVFSCLNIWRMNSWWSISILLSLHCFRHLMTWYDGQWWSILFLSAPPLFVVCLRGKLVEHNTSGNCADGMRALYNSKTTIRYHVLVQNCLFIEISMTLEEWLLSMKAAKFTFASHISYFGTHKFPGNHANAV